VVQWGLADKPTVQLKRREEKMSWNVFLSLIMFYSNNENAVPIIDRIGAFSDDLKSAFNIGKR